MLCKNKTHEWGKGQARDFTLLKEALSNRPVLAMHDPDAYTDVHTDACTNGLAAFLMQRGDENIMHRVSYYSRKTSRGESKYHSYELEALAVVCSLKRVRVYLIGVHFVIKTDCNSLKFLAEKR